MEVDLRAVYLEQARILRSEAKDARRTGQRLPRMREWMDRDAAKLEREARSFDRRARRG